MTSPTTPSSPKGGRPPKFDEPSRPITVTLPLRVLETLSQISSDRAKAIVQSVDAFLPSPSSAPAPLICEWPVNDNESLLAIADNRFLRRLPWLSLVRIAPGFHLIALKPDASLEKLELAIGDIIDTATDATPAELDLLRQLLKRLQTPRRNRAVRSESILVIRTSPA